MPIQITPGFKATIVIQDLKENILYQKICHSSYEMSDFILKYSTSKPGWSVFESLIMPLRTDSWHHFIKDFFLPTFIKGVLKSHGIALNLIVFSIILDFITLPIRFMALPLRVIYNYTHLEHKHPIEKDLGVAGHKSIKLCYTEEDVSVYAPYQDDQGNNLQIAKKLIITGQKIVALKTPMLSSGLELPFFKEQKSVTDYLNTNGQWDIAEETTNDCKKYFEPLYPKYW